MAFRQSYEAATGAVRGAITGSEPIIVLTEYVIPTGVLVNDITEMGAIPHATRVVDVNVYTNGLGVDCTVDVGTLSGQYAKNDATRTVGNEFYAAASAETDGRAARATKNSLAFVPSESATGFGVKFLGAAPTAGQKLWVAVTVMSK